MQKGEGVTLKDVTPEQHFTQPPPRYTEASLVKKMEELGIGRPSTYASILRVLQDRDRTSVVSGKSVSVRVDLGGRRIIKKKTTRKYKNSKRTTKQTKSQ